MPDVGVPGAPLVAVRGGEGDLLLTWGKRKTNQRPAAAQTQQTVTSLNHGSTNQGWHSPRHAQAWY